MERHLCLWLGVGLPKECLPPALLKLRFGPVYGAHGQPRSSLGVQLAPSASPRVDERPLRCVCVCFGKEAVTADKGTAPPAGKVLSWS